MRVWLSLTVGFGLALPARGQTCRCLHQGDTLPSSVWNGSVYENLTNVQVYGTTCAAWDSMPGTPMALACDQSTANFSSTENWCNVPWCYVGAACITAISSAVFPGYYLSYDICGGTDCYTDSAASGCPWDPHGDSSFTDHNLSAGCGCSDYGRSLSLSPSYYAAAYELGWHAIEVYGTSCAAWNSVLGTPFVDSCPSGSDWCHQNYNLCTIPWCLVGPSCTSKIATNLYGLTLHYSYETCGGLDCDSNSRDEADWPNLPAACPYRAAKSLASGCTAWSGTSFSTSSSFVSIASSTTTSVTPRSPNE